VHRWRTAGASITTCRSSSTCWSSLPNAEIWCPLLTPPSRVRAKYTHAKRSNPCHQASLSSAKIGRPLWGPRCVAQVAGCTCTGLEWIVHTLSSLGWSHIRTTAAVTANLSPSLCCHLKPVPLGGVAESWRERRDKDFAQPCCAFTGPFWGVATRSDPTYTGFRGGFTNVHDWNPQRQSWIGNPDRRDWLAGDSLNRQKNLIKTQIGQKLASIKGTNISI